MHSNVTEPNCEFSNGKINVVKRIWKKKQLDEENGWSKNMWQRMIFTEFHCRLVFQPDVNNQFDWIVIAWQCYHCYHCYSFWVCQICLTWATFTNLKIESPTVYWYLIIFLKMLSCTINRNDRWRVAYIFYTFA